MKDIYFIYIRNCQVHNKTREEVYRLLLIEIAIPIICLVGISLGIAMYIMRDYKDLAIDESYWVIDLPS